MEKRINVFNKAKATRLLAILLALAVTITMGAPVSLAKSKKQVKEIKEPSVNAGSYIVMSGSTSEDVYAVYEDRKMAIGNITKLMTLMVTIDNIHDDNEYNNQVQIDKKLAKYGDEYKEGESVSVDNLITATIVGGSDQAAEALARYSASDRDIFISEMNSKAMEIGLMSTQFANPTGRYHKDHYSTAEECAIIAQYAMRYERIKTRTALDSASIKVSGKKNRVVTYTNTNPLLSSTKRNELYGNIKGGLASTMKEPTEFSQYVGIATDKEGMQLIVVMLEATPDKLAGDAINLFEYGFQKVKRNTIVKGDKAVGHVRVKGGAKTSVSAYTETKGYAYVPPEGSTDLVQTEVFIYDDVKAPLEAGSKVGEYRIYIADELKGTVDLVVKEDIKKGWAPSKIYISNFAVVLVCLVLFILAFIIIRLRAINRRKRKIREMRKREKIREMARKQEALDRDRKMRSWTYSKYYDSKEMDEAIKSSNKKASKK